MSQHTIRLLVGLLSIITATTASAISAFQTTNFFEDGNPVASPWFTSGVNGSPVSFAPSIDQNGAPANKSITFKVKNGPVQAGTVSSLVVGGTFTLTGNATADDIGGPWTGGNGIPLGIVVKFNTEITFSVGADSPANSFLTLSATNSTNGLGIAQGMNLGGQLDPTESLDVSAVTISNLTFSGGVPGYNVTNGAVGDFSPYAIRSAGDTNADGFNELTKVAGLYTVPPDGSGKPTIGFGGASTTATGDGLPGDGVLAGHLAISTGFDFNAGNNGHTNQFGATPVTGPWTFRMLTGSMALKGIGYQYNVSYDISPVGLAGDFNHNGIVDAADYVLWKNGDPAADANGDSVIDQTDYNAWYSNFGNTNPGPGAGSGLGSAAVPEPASLWLVIMGLAMAWSRRGSR
jgi:hypothetical protein